MTPLTRREFFHLTEQCRDYALELARYDQWRVDLAQCHKFNKWLPELKAYDQLAPALRTLQPARPIARWQVITLAVVLVFVLMSFTASRSPQPPVFSFTFFFGLILLYFVPERLYGTTIELLEAKVLRVVEALEALLRNGDMGFSEAAFFQAKENLDIARRELRQQIDLAHRR